MGEIADLSGQLQLTAALTLTDNTPEKAKVDLSSTFSFPLNLAFGTGASQANKQIQDSISVANGAPVSIDLEDGTEEDSFGGDFDANNIKGLIIYHKASSSASSIDLSGSFITARLNTMSLAPGEWIAVGKPAAGWPVAAATNEVVTFTNPDASNNADIQYLFIGDDA